MSSCLQAEVFANFGDLIFDIGADVFYLPVAEANQVYLNYHLRTGENPLEFIFVKNN